MKIHMVSEHASPLAVVGGVDAGGQNVHVAALATHLASLGNEVVVHTRRDDASLPGRVEMGPGVVVDHVNAGPARPVPKDELVPHMGAFAAELRRSWQVDRPDLVHSHFWMSGMASLAAAEPLDVPVIHTFHALGVVKRRHQGDKDTSPCERNAIERKILGAVDGVVATCRDEVGELAAMGAGLERVWVVPCGVDLSLFRPRGPVERRRRPRLVATGRLVERKGLADVVAALAELPEVELVIAGGPDAAELDHEPEARRLRHLAEHHGVADRVELRGRVAHEDVPPLIRSADAVVSVPWYEPFGIVPVEAMACGVPVVASAVGGQLDTVENGVTGLHVPPRDPSALAHAVRCLLDNRDVARGFGWAGVRRARRYTWSRVAYETVTAYDALTAGVRAEAVR